MNAIVGLSATRGCYCFSARKLARTLTRHYEEYLRPHDLRATQFTILAALSLKGPTPLGELAALLGLEHSTLTRGADLLAGRGLLSSGDSEDGRERVLQITAEGLSKLEAALPAWEQAQAIAGERIARGEWGLPTVP